MRNRALVRVLVLAVWVSLATVPAVASGPAEAWTSRSSASDDGWRSVAYGDGMFVAVARNGAGGRVMTSSDGITWSPRTAATAAVTWHSVAYGAGRFVAVGYESVLGVTEGRVMTSPDGVAWTASSSVPAGQWFSVAFGGGTFIAVATSNGGAMTSPDGLTWTLQVAAPTGFWQEIAFGSPGGVPTFVAVSLNGSSMRSTDGGVNWTVATDAIVGSADWISVAYGAGRFVAVPDGASGVAPMRSSDGLNWVAATTVSPHYWESVAFGEGVFVAVGYNQLATAGTVMTSPDGDVWTARTPAADRLWTSVASAPGIFVAVAESGTGDRVMTSGTFIPSTDAAPSVAVPSMRVACVPLEPRIGDLVTCHVEDGPGPIDVLWRAAHSTVFAATGVRLDEDGTGTFTFTVPSAALGEELTVELVEWAGPVSLGVVGGPVPGAVPAGDEPLAPRLVGLLALAGLFALRRRAPAED